MSQSARTRRGVALIAAYVVALQALLLPLSVAAGGPFTSSLCAAATSADGSQAPGSHDSGCPCAAGCGMQCCVQALAGPPQEADAFSLTRVCAITPALLIKPVIRMADRSPQAARAPPVA